MVTTRSKPHCPTQSKSRRASQRTFKTVPRKTAYDQQFAEIGEAYTFIAIERNTKLVLTHYVGKRTSASTEHFIAKLAHATSTIPYQLTADGFTPYVTAVEKHLLGRVHFGQLIKVYSKPADIHQRYSPGEVTEVVPVKVFGNPERRRMCTSIVERFNNSIRQGMRRMTRLSLGHSKKWANHEAAFSLFIAYHNFCRVHSSLKQTPAMAHKLTDRIWTIRELIAEYR